MENVIRRHNKVKKVFSELDDFIVRELDIEINELNKRIDRKIKRGMPYDGDSLQHQKAVELRRSILWS